jgi:hypothetical protein
MNLFQITCWFEVSAVCTIDSYETTIVRWSLVTDVLVEPRKLRMDLLATCGCKRSKV